MVFNGCPFQGRYCFTCNIGSRVSIVVVLGGEVVAGFGLEYPNGMAGSTLGVLTMNFKVEVKVDVAQCLAVLVLLLNLL